MADATPEGRAQLLGVLQQVSQRPASQFADCFDHPELPLLSCVPTQQAQAVFTALQGIGAHVELRRAEDATSPTPSSEHTGFVCPTCGFAQPLDSEECVKCGLLFTRWQREKLEQDQIERQLERSLDMALHQRKKHIDLARDLQSRFKVSEQALTLFGSYLASDEVVFASLWSREGMLLLTSRRLLFELEHGIASIPWEVVEDLDHSDMLVKKKGMLRIIFKFVCDLPLPGKPAKSIARTFEKEASWVKDTILDWVYARSFICASCHLEEATFRRKGEKVFMRCMHCATDHEVDMHEAIALPVAII